jgi:hypothetical protein
MDFKQAQEQCICEGCPSYSDCGESLAFCLWETGISKCIKEENGCICPGCPVTDKLHFTRDYYCTLGNEKAQVSR